MRTESISIAAGEGRPGFRTPYILFAAVAAAAFAIYAFITPRVSGMGDGSEFTLVLATNGVAHPTGYPLYTAAGHLFCAFVHALGAPWPYAANLWSVAGAAVAIFFLLLLAWRLIPAGPQIGGAPRLTAALLPAVVFLFNPIWVDEVTVAEIGTWHVAWTLGAACFFLAAVREIHDPGATRAAIRARVVLWGVLGGIGLAHHVTSVFVSGPLSIALVIGLIRNRRWSYSLAGWALLGAVIPISSYGIIFWRAWHPARFQWPALEPSVLSVMHHITGEQYRHFFGYFKPSEPHRYMLAHGAYPFLFPGLVLFFILAARARSSASRLAAAGLLAGALTVTLQAFSYGVPDPASYFAPAVVLALAATAPFVAMFLAHERIPALMRAGLQVAGAAGVALLLFFWYRNAAAIRGDVASFERIIRSMWSSIKLEQGFVFWPDDRYVRLIEYQMFRGEKPGLYVSGPEVLMDDHTRRKFKASFGFDPMEGLNVPYLRPGQEGEEETKQSFLVTIIRNVNARTDLPVIIFDPSVPVVKLLAKGGGGDAGAPQGPGTGFPQ